MIEDNDAYLNKKDITSQLIPKIRKNLYESAIKIPRYVATPLPPLNFNQMGKIWPMKQIKAEYEIRFSK